MALVKLSAMVSEMKGKLNGSVLQGSPFGQMIRNNKYSKSGTQTVWDMNKAQLATLASQFRDLSSAQLATWQTQTANYPFIDKFGDSYTPSAFQLYMALNLRLLDNGLSKITSAVAPVSITDLTSVSVGWDGTSGLYMYFDTYPDTDVYLIAYATGNISANRSVANLPYKHLGAQLAYDTGSLYFNSAYPARFGFTPADGRIAFSYRLINSNTGQWTPLVKQGITYTP